MDMFSFVLGIHLGVELLGHMVTMFNLFKNCQTVFHTMKRRVKKLA